MFQNQGPTANESAQKLSSTINIIEDGVKNIGKMLSEIMNPKNILKDAALINNAVANMTTNALGQGRVISDMLTNTMAQANVETLKFGVSTEENVALFSSINKELQNTKILTNEQIINMQALAKIAGLTNEDMAKFAVNFDTLGLGIDQSVEKIHKLQREARGYGINVGQFMRTVGENIKLVASFNFKGGVNGLAKMVAQAQSLRIDMSKTVAFAEDMLSPEKAIETAAGFQMLGGAVGKLGDPFQLLHMAQTDMAGLQDSLVDMASSSATFNEETGQFDIPVTEMYRLREAAKLAGMSYQDFSEMALNSAKKTKKLEFLEGLSNIPEEQKEMIANLGEIREGKVMISVDDELVEASQLVPDQLAKLSSLEEDMGKSDKQLAAESVGHLAEIENSLKSLAALPESIVIEEGGFMNVMNSLSTNINDMTTVFTEKIKSIDFNNMLSQSYQKMVPNVTKEQIEGVFDGASKVATALMNKIKDIDFDSELKELLKDLKISEATFNATDVYLDASNVYDASNSTENVNTLEENAQSANDLVVTSRGESFKTAVDDYIFAISEQNLSNLSNTISALSTNTISSNNPSSADLNVNGTVRVDIAGTNVNMTESQLNDMVRNNPTLIATIMKQITGGDNNYGGVNT